MDATSRTDTYVSERRLLLPDRTWFLMRRLVTNHRARGDGARRHRRGDHPLPVVDSPTDAADAEYYG